MSVAETDRAQPPGWGCSQWPCAHAWEPGLYPRSIWESGQRSFEAERKGVIREGTIGSGEGPVNTGDIQVRTGRMKVVGDAL